MHSRTILFLLALGAIAATPAHAKDITVQGHVRRDGTYVEPYRRTSPNNRAQDNYTTKGNSNPYTGKSGYRDPFAPSRSTARPKHSW